MLERERERDALITKRKIHAHTHAHTKHARIATIMRQTTMHANLINCVIYKQNHRAYPIYQNSEVGFIKIQKSALQ